MCMLQRKKIRLLLYGALIGLFCTNQKFLLQSEGSYRFRNANMVYCASDVEFTWGVRGSAPHAPYFVSSHSGTTKTQNPVIYLISQYELSSNFSTNYLETLTM